MGPFTLTPYLTDDSAYDAYALLIEADGKRFFYSGDFREHGRKAGLFEKLLRDPPRPIDVLLAEGTTIGRDNTTESLPTESDLEACFLEKFHATLGMALVWSSGQNIDRLVTIFRVAKRAGRTLIIDLFIAAVLAATDNPRLPQSDWPEIRVFLPQWQRVRVKEQALFDVLRPYHAHRIYPEALAKAAPRSVLLFRPSMRGDRDLAHCLEGAHLFYSLWGGYLIEDSAIAVTDWMEGRGIELTSIYTSGHASVQDLQRLTLALAPNCLVPIHTFHAVRYPELFANVEPKEDGV